MPLLVPIANYGLDRLSRRGLNWEPPAWRDGEPVDVAFLKGAPPRRSKLAVRRNA